MSKLAKVNGGTLRRKVLNSLEEYGRYSEHIKSSCQEIAAAVAYGLLDDAESKYASLVEHWMNSVMRRIAGELDERFCALMQANDIPMKARKFYKETISGA